MAPQKKHQLPRNIDLKTPFLIALLLLAFGLCHIVAETEENTSPTNEAPRSPHSSVQFINATSVPNLDLDIKGFHKYEKIPQGTKISGGDFPFTSWKLRIQKSGSTDPKAYFEKELNKASNSASTVGMVTFATAPAVTVVGNGVGGVAPATTANVTATLNAAGQITGFNVTNSASNGSYTNGVAGAGHVIDLLGGGREVAGPRLRFEQRHPGLAARDQDGIGLPAAEQLATGRVEGGPVADVDADGKEEVFVGFALIDDDGRAVLGFSATIKKLTHWAMKCGQSTPNCSMANMVPVRPAPVWISSAMRRIPYSSQMALTFFINSGGGAINPPSP